jgi:hypothetical protein
MKYVMLGVMILSVLFGVWASYGIGYSQGIKDGVNVMFDGCYSPNPRTFTRQDDGKTIMCGAIYKEST